jgi:multidrug efflux system outer membrane protein
MRDRLVAACLALAACNFAPAYERPSLPVPGQFAGAAQGSGLSAVDRGWRVMFGDARLQRLLELALANNRDLRIAALNIEIARAQYGIERSALAPSISGVASATVVGTENGVSPATAGLNSYRVGLGASYELDLFGRVRNLKDAALETYLATVEARRATHLALVGQVVTEYLRQRAFEEQHAIARRTEALVGEGVDLTRRLFAAGQRSELDAQTAEAQLYAARAELSRLERLRAQSQHVLAVLIGQPVPADLPDAQPLDTQAIIADLPAGVPSEVLLRRPDVLAAEHILRSANANIGVARAAFFPSISLTAFAGLASTTLGNLFSGGLAWSVAPTLSLPLFNYGRDRATLEVSQLRKRIEVARYEQTIQNAFREVADALVARATLEAQLAAQTARADAEQKRFQLSEMRYKSGIESYQIVLLAQQDLYTTQQQLIELRLAGLTNLTSLYVALGGGWRDR